MRIVRVALAAVALGVAACHHAAPPVNGPTRQAMQAPVDGQIVELQFGRQVPVRPGEDGQVIVLPFGSVLLDAVWKQLEIAVCWETPDNVEPRYRDTVKHSIDDTWQKESRLRFTGWSACDEGSPGIHILVADDEPHTVDLGRSL